MKKLWAILVTGLLGFTAASQAGEPIVLPALPAPGTITTATAPGTKIELPSASTTLPVNVNPVTDAGGSPAAASVIVSVKPCAACTTCAPAATPCSSGTCAKPCATCCQSGPGWGNGKLRAFFGYHPPRTPLGDCGADVRFVPFYTLFLDTPCRSNWKPVACCENNCRGCASCGAAPACGGCATPGPLPLPVQDLPAAAPGR